VACGLLGVYQPSNALLAAAAARELGADEGDPRGPPRRPLAGGSDLSPRPLVILDGAAQSAGPGPRASLRRVFPGGPSPS
jgi:hypothetical protein